MVCAAVVIAVSVGSISSALCPVLEWAQGESPWPRVLHDIFIFARERRDFCAGNPDHFGAVRVLSKQTADLSGVCRDHEMRGALDGG